VSAVGNSATVRRFLAGVERTNLALVLLALVATHLVAGFGQVFSGVLAGGLLGLVNWRVVVWLAGRFMGAAKRSHGFYAVVAGAKLVLLMPIIWLMLTYLPIDALGFLLGISSLMVAIFLYSFWSTLAPVKSEEQEV
jgi:hypothetical protein